MKKIVILSVLIAALVAGAIVYLNKQKTPPPPAPIAESAPQQTEQPAGGKIPVTKPEQPQTPSINASAVAQAPTATTATTETNSSASTNTISKAVDALLAATSGKHEMFEQLRKSGQLDAVIAELQQRAAANPTDAEIPTTLGEALLNKVKSLHDNGDTDRNELGILALQADQSFNTALKIDPKNWEAQFVKASTMFYWPPDGQRDGDAAQMLANLIDQQDGMPSNPVFAQTYLALGNQYQKMGKMNEAIATWTLGAQKFPGDPTLQKKLAGQ